MRIAHILTEQAGGGQTYARYLAAAARDRGDTVATVAPLTGRSGTVSLSDARAVASEIRRADLVHAHGVRAALWCLPWLPRRLVVTLHGLHAVRRSRVGARREVAQMVAGLAMRRADVVICVSRDELTTVSAMSTSLARRCRVILNGVAPVAIPTVEDRAVARRRLRLAQDAPVLLFLGGLREQKNPMLAVAAVRLAARRVPGLRMLMAGDGPLQAGVRAAAGEEVIPLGWRNDGSILLAACDAQLNTARWEGLSLSLLEGLWRGRPAIATDAPGNAEAVGNAGYVVEPNPRAVADAIERFFGEPGLRERLSICARERAETLFDAGTMVETTLELYDEVAGHPIRYGRTSERPGPPDPVFGEGRR